MHAGMRYKRKMAYANRGAVQGYDDGIFRLTATEPWCDHGDRNQRPLQDVSLYPEGDFSLQSDVVIELKTKKIDRF